MPRVLCVDDKDEILANITEIISEWTDSPHGTFEVVGEKDFSKAIERLKTERYDLVTLDLHGGQDPDPLNGAHATEEQEGKRVLDALRAIRFVPVVFYTGFAEKIAGLESGVVRVVKKGDNDLANVRAAIDTLYTSGISKLLGHIEEENRRYIWDTLDTLWGKMKTEGGIEDLAYLLARRLGARLSSDSIKDFLNHDTEKFRPIEMYIFPPLEGKIKTGCIIKEAAGTCWIVATPACDFAQNKVDSVLLIGIKPLAEFPQYKEWSGEKWNGMGNPPSKDAQKKFTKLQALVENRAGDRYRFLPGTFFLAAAIADFQYLKQVPFEQLGHSQTICRLDSPFREELLGQLSRYYGRMGVPALNMAGFYD